MPRQQVQTVDYNTFVKGIITEAGPLTYPPNASLDERNFVLNRDGSRQRRFGMDFEEDYAMIDTGLDLTEDVAIQSYQWDNAANQGNLDIVVVQVGDKIYLFDGNSSTLSQNLLNGGLPVEIGNDVNYSLSFAALYGKLIVSIGSEEFLVLEYDPIEDEIIQSTHRLLVRDLFGIYEDVAEDARLSSISKNHYYNLRNQGWPKKAACATTDRGGETIYTNPITHTQKYGGKYNGGPGYVYPSNADVYWAARNVQASNTEGVGAYSPWELTKQNWGPTRATQGTFVIDLFNRSSSRTSESGLSGLTQDESRGNISSVAAYAGRVFYSIAETARIGGDQDTPSIATMVFFSQVGNSIAKLKQCHGFNNPTTEDINEPLATDGGFVTIPEAGQILKLVPLGDSLFVFATNGVWEIHGGEGSFTATSQGLSKASNIGALSADNITVSENVISYWSEGGIYRIEIDPVSLRGSAVNITQNTIQSLYDDIPAINRATARGTYDSVARQLRWMYKDDTALANDFNTQELIYDLNLQSFYVNDIGRIEGRTPYVVGYVNIPGIIFNKNEEEVTSEGVLVTALGSPVTVTFREVDETTRSSTKYLTARKNELNGHYSFTFSNYRDIDYADWRSADGVGVDAPAYLITGYQTGGDSQRFKQVHYITCNFRQTEQGFIDDGEGGLDVIAPSSCFVQAQWEWTDSANSGRWGRKFQAYRLPRFYTPTGDTDPFDTGFTVVTTKSKLRGKGRSLSLLFESEPGKDCHLYGWSINLSSNNLP